MPKPLLYIFTFFLLTLTMITGGCSSSTKSYNIVFERHQNLHGRTLEVDIVPSPPGPREQLMACSLNEYFMPGNKLRASLTKQTILLSSKDEKVQQFSINNRQWQAWLNSGAKELIILALLPEIQQDHMGQADARRRVIPLNNKYWPHGTKTINIQLTPGAIIVLTAPKK